MRLSILMVTGLVALFASFANAESDGDGLWAPIYEVFSHPRCANCHVGPDNIPRWSGEHYGGSKPHGMAVTGGPSRIGAESVLCSACHTAKNSPVPHGPPGAPIWLLAPVEMQWWDKSSQAVCEQIKDPQRNGGRTLAEVADHIAHDPLVLWGWEPGPGREPAPYSPSEVADFIRQWEAAGAPCPTET